MSEVGEWNGKTAKRTLAQRFGGIVVQCSTPKETCALDGRPMPPHPLQITMYENPLPLVGSELDLNELNELNSLYWPCRLYAGRAPSLGALASPDEGGG